jgi:Na+-transporting methylmalonyl-CoA/oxaloacetate decarboxylase gamma subunit
MATTVTLVILFVVLLFGLIWIIGTGVRCYFGKNKEEVKYVRTQTKQS